MNLDETFGSVVDGQSQHSAMQGQTADGTRWSNVDFETSLYADRRLGIDSDLVGEHRYSVASAVQSLLTSCCPALRAQKRALKSYILVCVQDRLGALA